MLTRYALMFRGKLWQTHTISSDNRESADTSIGHTLTEAKRNDPECADDYAVTEMPPRETQTLTPTPWWMMP